MWLASEENDGESDVAWILNVGADIIDGQRRFHEGAPSLVFFLAHKLSGENELNLKMFSGQAAQSYDPKVVATAARNDQRDRERKERKRELGMKYEVPMCTGHWGVFPGSSVKGMGVWCHTARCGLTQPTT